MVYTLRAVIKKQVDFVFCLLLQCYPTRPASIFCLFYFCLCKVKINGVFETEANSEGVCGVLYAGSDLQFVCALLFVCLAEKTKSEQAWFKRTKASQRVAVYE